MATTTDTLLVEKEKFRSKTIPEIEMEYNVKILLAFVRGSQMYGTATANSDVDITFVYQQSTREILKGNYKEQITVGGNDIVGYEIERFLNLLSVNNPNMLESLDIPADCMIYKHSSMDVVLNQEIWLSRLIENSILGYANSQIKKATGLEKNMNNAQPRERKSILEFCHVVQDGNTVPFLGFFSDYKAYYDSQADYNNWGLVKMDNGKQLYSLYANHYAEDEYFRGLVKEDSVNLRLSDVPNPKNRPSVTFVYNLDGFEVHCKQHKAYWQWVVERNDERHLTNQSHGKNYDSKNMMHLYRLLNMAYRISQGGLLQVKDDNVSELMKIRRGEIEYDLLIEQAELMFNSIKNNFETLALKDKPDEKLKKDLLLQFRLADFK